MALSGYGVYAEVTFAASAVDEAIPFCTVYLSDLPTAWHDAMANAGDTDGRTIRVTKSDGTTECAVYVPPGSVNTSTDTGALFFRATDLSAVLDTTYMIWVGNAASTMYLSSDTYGRNAVFYGYTGSYAGVYILSSTDDCTGQGRDLTGVNSPGQTASGFEGITAATYNGTSSYHEYQGTAGVTNWPLTLECLAYADVTTGTRRPFSVSLNTSTRDAAFFEKNTSGHPIGSAVGASGSYATATYATSMGATTWRNFAVSRDANTGTTILYKDGAQVATSATTIATPTAFNRTTIGVAAFNSTYVNYWDGNIAVALLSGSVRSADYMSTMNKNWLGTLYTAGSVQYVSGTTGKLKLQSAATTSASGTLADWATVTNALTPATDVATTTVDDVTTLLSEFLELTNIAYNFAIPSGKSNYSAKFFVTRRFQTGGGRGINDQSIRFIDESGSYSGTDMAIGTAWESVVTTKEYTVSGTTLSDTRFDASTGIAIQVTGVSSNGNTQARVEFVCVEITWDDSAPATSYGNFFLAFL